MSDYLWDKTGKADDETKRLEELLGGLKFQPRPLELPVLPARDFRAARTRSLLSWPRLAVAASLTAALLIGAWLVMNERRATKSEAPQMAGTGTTGTGKKGEALPLATTTVDTPKGSVEKPQSNGVPSTAPRENNAAARPRPRRPDLAGGTRIRMPRANRIEAARHDATSRVTPEPREQIARKFTDEEIAAAEKVMFALRLTSEKLSYARQQVQDAGRREGNR